MKKQISTLMIALLSVGIVACNDDNNDSVSNTPIKEEATPNSIQLERMGTYDAQIYGASAAEIPAYDAASKRLFVVNAQKGMIDVLDLTNPNQPIYLQSLDAKQHLANSEVNSVAVHNGIVALAVQAEQKTDPGIVAFFNAKDASFISKVEVGALPDMLTFTPDGKKILVANEAEPSEGYAIDPEGSISIVDISDIKNPKAKVAGFTAWNDSKAELVEKGIRIFGPAATVAQDLEPEYITVSADGKTAWASLQENNAIAEIDLSKDQVMDIFPMGYKDHSLTENALDAGDRDSGINIKAWPELKGMYMPDAIAQYQVDGQTYLVTANEGDAREWLKDETAYFTTNDLSSGYAEEIRVKHLFNSKGFRTNGDYAAHLRQISPGVKGAKLNPVIFGECKLGTKEEVCVNNLIDDSQLGRLTISWTQGYQKDASGQPILDENGLMTYNALYAYGGRSFSIVDPKTKAIIWDSGSEFERKVTELFPENFNSNHEEIGIDNRSDNKGPEPEGVTLGKVGQKTFAFIGLERVGGIMVYDISNPKAPIFVQYFNDRSFKQEPLLDSAGQPVVDKDGVQIMREKSDLGPEGLVFISAKDSPNGKPLLVVGNEVSGTTTVYQIKTM